MRIAVGVVVIIGILFSSISVVSAIADREADIEECRKIHPKISASTNERYRSFAREIGGTLAPNGRLVVCEGEHPLAGDAFAVVYRGGENDTPRAWGIVIGPRLLTRLTDQELRGLIAHEIAHNAYGGENCYQLRGRRQDDCEIAVDAYAARLVGSCAVLAMLHATRREVEGSRRPSATVLRSLSRRIAALYHSCRKE